MTETEKCPLCDRPAEECHADPCPPVQNSSPLLDADERAKAEEARKE